MGFRTAKQDCANMSAARTRTAHYDSRYLTRNATVMTIPLTAVVDFLLWGKSYGLYDIFGAFLVIIGFLLLVAGGKRVSACVQALKTTT